MSNSRPADESRDRLTLGPMAHECEPGCAVCAAYARVLRSWAQAVGERPAGADPVGAARRDPRVRRAVSELSTALGALTGAPRERARHAGPAPGPESGGLRRV